MAPVVAASVVFVLGLGVRMVTDGPFAKYAGIALYAAFIYTLVVVVGPRTRPFVAALISLAACWAIEFAQLTPLPASLSARSVLLRLVFGTTFNLPDLAWYAVGVALAAAASLAYGHRGHGHRGYGHRGYGRATAGDLLVRGRRR
jgi:hypothetical protein